MTQPKAIFLAEVLEAELRSAAHHDAAAAELRRLHAQRDALLESLRWIAQLCPEELLVYKPHMMHLEAAYGAGACARAAIKAAEQTP
jgi:hypothetical protein